MFPYSDVFISVLQLRTVYSKIVTIIVTEGRDGEVSLVSQEQEKDEEEADDEEEQAMKRKEKILESPKAIVPYSSMLIFSSTNP